MKELNRNWLIFIAAVFAILWLGLLVRGRSLHNQLKSLQICEVTIEALDADTAQPIRTTIKDSKSFYSKYFPADLTQTSIPPSAAHLQFISAKPVKFTVTSPGYTAETVKIDASTPDHLSVRLKKLPTQQPPANPSP